MAKRFALLIIGIALMLGAFFVYQMIAGPDVLGGKKPKKIIVNPPATLPTEWESRDENGVLQFIITAGKAPEAALDGDKKPIAGKYIIDHPVATYFDRTGLVLQVRANSCTAIIDQGPKGAGGGLLGNAGTKGVGNLTIRGGELDGDIRMTINPAPKGAATTSTSASDDLLAGGLRIYFDDKLQLDGIQEVLTTKGGIHVRSDKIAFDAQGMQFVFDRKAQRLEYLSIEKGNQIIVRDAGKWGDFLTTTTQPATPAAAPALAAAQSRPAAGTTAIPASASAKEINPAIAYRLSFGQDVKAVMGERTMVSDRLFVLFMAPAEIAKENRKPAATQMIVGESGVAPTVRTPAVLQIPEKPEPIAPARANDAVITWAGSMEIRPSADKELKLANKDDMAVEALGTAAKPVTINDPRFNVQSGRLWYHKAGQVIDLEPRDFKKVVLAQTETRDSTERRSVEGQNVSINLNTKQAVLRGPGTILAQGKNGNTTVAWDTRMDLDLEITPDPKDAAKTTLAVRRAVLNGVGIKSDTFDLKAKVLDALIANIMDNGKQTQALEHLVATGDVVVNTFRKANASGEQGGMKTQRMEIDTARFEGFASPQPSKLTAEGNVVAWRFTDKSKGIGAGATAAGDTKGMQKESITTPKLVADLKPRAKAVTASAPGADNTLAGVGQNFDVPHFIAENGATVEIVPPADSKTGVITAVATTLEAWPLENRATLKAAAGAKDVRVAMRMDTGENGIVGRTVELVQSKTEKSFTVLGAGVFNFTLPADKTRKVPEPMVITWQERMRYDDVTHLAEFAGKPIARVLPTAGAADQADQARLQCDNKLSVQLKEVASTASSASATPASSLAIGGTSLDLDWIKADANVEAYGAQLDSHNKLLTRLRLSAPNLLYTKETNTFAVDGAGAMVVENFKPDKADAKVSAAGESRFAWQGGLKFDGVANTINLSQNVKFWFMPTKPFNFSSNLNGPTASAPATPGARQPDIAYLETNQLVTTLAKSQDATGRAVASPIGLGGGGNQEVSKVDALGGAILTAGTYRVVEGKIITDPTYIISGKSLSFDVPANVALMTGTEDEPVVITRPSYGRSTATELKFDMTKDKMHFSGKNLQGNLTNFGG